MTPQPDPVSQRLGRPQQKAPPAVVEVVRSTERLDVGHAVRVSGRAVLRKYVVTEIVTQTVEVRREEVRLDLEPLDSLDGVNGVDSADVGEGTDADADSYAVADRMPFDGRVIEVVLHREVPVVQLHVQATETVRLHIDTVTNREVVAGDVRHEELDIDAPRTWRASD